MKWTREKKDYRVSHKKPPAGMTLKEGLIYRVLRVHWKSLDIIEVDTGMAGRRRQLVEVLEGLVAQGVLRSACEGRMFSKPKKGERPYEEPRGILSFDLTIEVKAYLDECYEPAPFADILIWVGGRPSDVRRALSRLVRERGIKRFEMKGRSHWVAL